ncbi:MAG: cupin-like domain-containing protein [Pseudomonadota bacterium]
MPALPQPRPLAELDGGYDSERFFAETLPVADPVVIRHAAADWPLVCRARDSWQAACDYLLEFYEGAPVTAFRADAGAAGRIFYDDAVEKMNFRQVRTGMDQVFSELTADTEETVYMGSMALDQCLPGSRTENSLPLAGRQATVRIWIGSATLVAAHYDVMDNIACVCAGRRRFTLFPPDQLSNLYVGPLDFTPAGQAVSMVDPRAPDLERFPRYAEALGHARTAVLEPGDAIFIPSMWWHQVEALERRNILINHWWRDAPPHAGPPLDALLMAILTLRDIPAQERAAWRDLFEHYVFDFDGDQFAHIPKSRRGVLGPLDDDQARQLRAMLRNRLNR